MKMWSILDYCLIDFNNQNAPNNTGDFGGYDLAIPAIYFFSFICFNQCLGATGAPVTYQVNGQPYEGYYISPSKGAPFVLLIHDWDSLTDYEVKRAHMLADLAKELESTGIDHAMITCGGSSMRLQYLVVIAIKKRRIKNPGSVLRNFLLKL